MLANRKLVGWSHAPVINSFIVSPFYTFVFLRCHKVRVPHEGGQEMGNWVLKWEEFVSHLLAKWEETNTFVVINME